MLKNSYNANQIIFKQVYTAQQAGEPNSKGLLFFEK